MNEQRFLKSLRGQRADRPNHALSHRSARAVGPSRGAGSSHHVLARWESPRFSSRFCSAGERLRIGGLALLVLLVGMGSMACAGVRPEQRAILADPTMVPQAEPLEAEAREHVFDNREGATGGGSVQGGGCGCN